MKSAQQSTCEKEAAAGISGSPVWTPLSPLIRSSLGKLTYHFRLGGLLYGGVITSFDSTLADRPAGQPVWALCVEKDPMQNTLYPPLKHF